MLARAVGPLGSLRWELGPHDPALRHLVGDLTDAPLASGAALGAVVPTRASETEVQEGGGHAQPGRERDVT